MRASWRMEEGYGDPTPALCAHPRQLRLCTRTVKQIPRRAAHGVPLRGASVARKTRCSGLWQCNFRPVSGEPCADDGALVPKRVHSKRTRARSCGIRRPCPVMLLAEKLVGEARARRARSMDARERTVVAVFAALYCVAAVLIAVLVPSERDVSPLLIAALLLGHAAVSQVRFEFGMGFVVPEQLVVIPMLLLCPLPYVPVLAAAASALSLVPDFIRGSWAKDRWLKPI